MKRKKDYRRSSGNVFRDLGLAAPEELLVKAELAARISELIESRKLTQIQAAKALGVDQPKVSALLRGRLSGGSTERLLRFLIALGSDVQIVVRMSRERKKAGHLEVVSV